MNRHVSLANLATTTQRGAPLIPLGQNRNDANLAQDITESVRTEEALVAHHDVQLLFGLSAIIHAFARHDSHESSLGTHG